MSQDDVSSDVSKSFYKSKNFWTATLLLVFSVLSFIQSFELPPKWNAAITSLFAIIWIVLRFITEQPVTPSINIPDPRTVFKRKD